MSNQVDPLVSLLFENGIRPTRTRTIVAQHLFGKNLDKANHHFTAQQLYIQLLEEGISISFATVYNVVNCFVDAGLLKEISLSVKNKKLGDAVYYDTNTTDHYHLIDEQSGEIIDISKDKVKIDYSFINNKDCRVELVIHRLR